MDRFVNTAVVIVFIMAITFLAGSFYASFAHPANVELASVDGRVTLHGKPQANLGVDFSPADGRRGSEGCTDAEGYYSLFYTSDKPGGVIGHQQVIVFVPEVTDASQKVISPRKNLMFSEVDVRSGANRFDFDLAN
jgi:hypothetical protein